MQHSQLNKNRYIKFTKLLVIGLVAISIPVTLYGISNTKIYNSFAKALNAEDSYYHDTGYKYITAVIDKNGKTLDYTISEVIDSDLLSANATAPTIAKLIDKNTSVSYKPVIVKEKTLSIDSEDKKSSKGIKSETVLATQTVVFKVSNSEIASGLLLSTGVENIPIVNKTAITSENLVSAVSSVLNSASINSVFMHKNTENRPQDNTVDLVIMGAGYDSKTESNFKQYAESMKNQILKDDFFSTQKHRINIIRIDTRYTLEDLGCSSFIVGSTPTVWCTNTSKVGQILNEVGGDFPIVVPNLQDAVGGSTYSFIVALAPRSITAVVHELGHSLGGLADEYYTQFNSVTGINTPNCKADCAGYDEKFTPLGCVPGCAVSADPYRTTTSSVMSISSPLYSFNNASKDALLKRMLWYASEGNQVKLTEAPLVKIENYDYYVKNLFLSMSGTFHIKPEKIKGTADLGKVYLEISDLNNNIVYTKTRTSAPFDFYLDLNALPDVRSSKYIITLYAHDKYDNYGGNSYRSSFGITRLKTSEVATFDTIDPKVEITSPVDKASINGKFTVKATATDNKKVQKVVFHFRNTNQTITDSDAPYQAEFQTGNIDDFPIGNARVIDARAYDEAGNEAVASRTIITAKNESIKPFVSITNIANNSNVLSGSRIKVKVDASDDSGIYKVEIGDAYLGIMYTDYEAPYETEYTLPVKNDGDGETIWATAYDTQGNTNRDLKSIRFYNNPTTPTPTITLTPKITPTSIPTPISTVITTPIPVPTSIPTPTVAPTTSSNAPGILSLPTSTTVVSGNQLFQWQTGKNIKEYKLMIGTRGDGDSNLYNQTFSAATVDTYVTGLPTTGNKIYVTLRSSYVNNNFEDKFYNFTTKSTASPTPTVVPTSIVTPNPTPTAIPTSSTKCPGGSADAAMTVSSPYNGQSVNPAAVEFKLSITCREGKVVIPYVELWVAGKPSSTVALDYQKEENGVSIYGGTKNITPNISYPIRIYALVTDKNGNKASDISGTYNVTKTLKSSLMQLQTGAVKSATSTRGNMFTEFWDYFANLNRIFRKY